jgi:hypothetical protein
MVEKSSDAPPKKKLSDQNTEQCPYPELQQLMHELMNQLTIMNLCCFGFRSAAANALDRSLSPEIDRIETTLIDMASLLAKLPQVLSTSVSSGSPAGLLRGKAKSSRSQPANVYSLFKSQRRSPRNEKN